MSDEKRAYIKNWLKKAENDLLNAKTILEAFPVSGGAPFDTVCFHCQQAVEKYLKACLVHYDIDVPRTHDLGELTELCAQLDKDFLTIKQPAESLSPYAAEIRYPDDFYLPTGQEAREALQKALHIKEILFSIILKTYEDP
jgi:HEPN domain-containing protein